MSRRSAPPLFATPSKIDCATSKRPACLPARIAAVTKYEYAQMIAVSGSPSVGVYLYIPGEDPQVKPNKSEFTPVDELYLLGQDGWELVGQSASVDKTEVRTTYT